MPLRHEPQSRQNEGELGAAACAGHEAANTITDAFSVVIKDLMNAPEIVAALQ